MRALGIDIGALSIGAALLEEGRVARVSYEEHRGDIRGSLERLLHREGIAPFDRVGVTGSLGARATAEAGEALHCRANEWVRHGLRLVALRPGNPSYQQLLKELQP